MLIFLNKRIVHSVDVTLRFFSISRSMYFCFIEPYALLVAKYTMNENRRNTGKLPMYAGLNQMQNRRKTYRLNPVTKGFFQLTTNRYASMPFFTSSKIFDILRNGTQRQTHVIQIIQQFHRLLPNQMVLENAHIELLTRPRRTLIRGLAK